MRLLLSAQGEIKNKASIIIYHGGGEERMKGGLHGFQGNRGEKQSLLTRYKGQGGGALQDIACQWRGSLKYYKALEGETQG